MGFGLVARKKIEPGTTLCFFGGELRVGNDIKPEKLTRKAAEYALFIREYSIAFVPELVVSLGALINDNPPNCKFVRVKGKKVPFFSAIQSIREIKKGEPLYINYGKHGVKKSFYYLDPKAYQILKETISKEEDLLIKENFSLLKKEMAKYALSTPAAFIRLHLDGPLSPKKTLHLLTKLERLDDEKEIIFHPLIKETAGKLLEELQKIKGEERESEIISLLENTRSFNVIDYLIQGQWIEFKKIEPSQVLEFFRLCDIVLSYATGSAIGVGYIGCADQNDGLKRAKLPVGAILKKVSLLPNILRQAYAKKLAVVVNVLIQQGLRDHSNPIHLILYHMKNYCEK